MNPVRYVAVSRDPSDPSASHEPVKYDRFVRGLLKPDTIKMEAVHIAMGIVGEAIEFLSAPAVPVEEMRKELGDMEFYYQAALTHHGFTEAEVYTFEEHKEDHNKFFALDDILPPIGEYADLVKKQHIYGQVIERERYRRSLGNICYCLQYLYAALRWDRQEILQLNATKLQARYAKLVFSTEESAARRDEPPHASIG